VFFSWTLLLVATSANAAEFAKIGVFFGGWEGLTTSTRLSALGGGDLADDSPATLLVNPAPLGSGNSAGFSYDHADFFGGADFQTYAGAAEYAGIRLNFARQDYGGSILIRTAFNPEGNGETFDFRERMSLMGLSYNFRQLIRQNSPFSCSVGLAWRKYTGLFGDVEGEGRTVDVGITLRWVTHHDHGWASLKAIASQQNVTNAKYTIDGRTSHLPHAHRFGLTFEGALRKTDHTDDRFKLLVAYSRNAQIETSYRSNSDHYGVEVVFFDLDRKSVV